ncbi:MAG: hypothetical protein Alis3KO_32080 [Aliiglaciecola sp.]
MYLSRFSVLVLFSLLAGCGGGGGSDSGGTVTNPPVQPPSPPTPTEMIADAQAYSVTQLKTAATSLATSRYSGLRTMANMDSELARQVFTYLFNDVTTELPIIGEEDFVGQRDVSGNVNITFSCFFGGSAQYSGTLDVNLKGNLSVTYSNCKQPNNNVAVSGKAALTINEISENNADIIYYYDNLAWQLNGQQIRLNGYSELKSTFSPNSGQYQLNSIQHVLFTIGNEQLLLEADLALVDGFQNFSLELSGNLYVKDEGRIQFDLDDVAGFPPYFGEGTVNLLGNKAVAFEFENGYSEVKYVEDTNGDEQFDVGAYYINLDDLSYGTETKTLVALTLLSLPPNISSPYLEYTETLNTTTPVMVSEGYISDPDTALEDLDVSYRWYLNGEQIAEQFSNVLPAHIAVFGDELEVSMVVFDGATSVESYRTFITLQDAPAEIAITNLPSNIRPGDAVQFVASVSDPDVGELSTASSLISSPSGVSIDEDGLVTWNVPTEFLFNIQNYEFTFGIPHEDGSVTDITVIPVSVVSENSLPLARSGMEVPYRGKSMSVADFDGDGLNEILSTDNNKSVFLLEYRDGKYVQKWVYPYALVSSGQINQVVSVNLDNDQEHEILVLTSNGIELIDGLDKPASNLYSTDSYLHFIAVADVNNDGVPEIAVLQSDSDYQYDEKSLVVFSADQPESLLFETSVDSAEQLVFADVDEDVSLELVINNGLVYDATTWENQWFSGTAFGSSLVTAGDYNGDGIAEIIGADIWGNIAAYSAVNRSQLDSMDNFNTCTLHSDDINNDGEDEIIVGDCQWGNVTAYKLVNNSFSQIWQIDSQDHSATSLVSGDSDNDGNIELHWGSGTSHSGANMFVSVDVTPNSATLKGERQVQLDSYSNAGWAVVSQIEENAIFFIPSTENGYDGSRYLVMDEIGDFTLSDPISSNWDGSRSAVATDFNNDGMGDIFVPSTDTYDGALSALQLSDGSVHWQIDGDFNSTIGLIKAYDLNGDGFDDAIYSDSSEIKAIDIENQLVISTYTFDSAIHDFTPVRIGDTALVIVSAGERLFLLATNGSVFSEQAVISQTCIRMELINADSDADIELACIQDDQYQYSETPQSLVIFDLGVDEFTEVKRSAINSLSRITDFAVDPSKTANQDLFIVTSTGDMYDYQADFQIKKFNTDGHVIWSSPALIGTPSHQGLKVRLDESSNIEILFATSDMMYWIK